jgi:hypothetical protein
MLLLLPSRVVPSCMLMKHDIEDGNPALSGEQSAAQFLCNYHPRVGLTPIHLHSKQMQKTGFRFSSMHGSCCTAQQPIEQAAAADQDMYLTAFETIADDLHLPDFAAELPV